MSRNATAEPTTEERGAAPGGIQEAPPDGWQPGSLRLRPWMLPLLALAGALAVWPLLKYQLGPDNELVIQLRSERPLRGGQLTLWRPGRPVLKRELLAEELPPSSAQPVELELVPLGVGPPEAKGVEVWLESVSSACGEPFDANRLEAGPGWIRGYHGYPAVWTGGEPGTLRYRAELCGPVRVRLGHHPYSGQALLRARGRDGGTSERRVNLYRPEGADGYSEEAIALPVLQPQQELTLQLPRRTEALELLLLGPRSHEVRSVRWRSTRSAPLWGAASPEQAAVLTAESDGVRVHLPRLAPGFWVPDLLDLCSVLGLAGVFGWALAARLGTGRLAAFARAQARWGKYALAPALAWGLLWATLFPGVVSFDPIVQWGEVLARHFVNWHPPLHTWWLWLVGGLFDSIGAVAGLQVLLFAVLWGRLVHEIEQWGAPRWACWGMVAWATLSPAFGYNVISVWKDALYGLVFAYSTLVLLRAERQGRLEIAVALRLAAALAAVALLRHNGPLVALPVLALALWRYRDRRARLALAGLFVALVVLVRGPVYSLAGVGPTPVTMRQALVVHRLGLLAQRVDPLPPADAELLERLGPLEEWRGRYSCVSVGPLLFDSRIRVERMEGQTEPYLALLARYARQAPGALLEHSICVTRYLWAPLTPLYIGPFDSTGRFVDPNPLGWTTRSWIPKLRARAWPFIQRTYGEENVLRAMVWQPATSLYLCALALAVACWRQRNAGPAVLLFGVLCNTLALLLLSPNPDLRFQWPLLLHTPLALALALLPMRHWRCGSGTGSAAEVPAGGEAVVREAA